MGTATPLTADAMADEIKGSAPVIENLGRNPVLVGRLYFTWNTGRLVPVINLAIALEILNTVYSCIALSLLTVTN